MKKLIQFVLILITFQLNAQISVNPAAFEVNQQITITVDINSTDSDCNGISNPGSVYMHSGIGDNTNAFGFSVVGNWGQDDGVGEMTNNGDGTYSITIIPETYYGLNATQAQNATQLGIVFRNEDGTQELKDNGCNDFILRVGIVNINVIEPTGSAVVVNSGDDLTVRTSLNFQGNLTPGAFELYFNNVFQTGGNGFTTYQGVITNITTSGTVRIDGSPLSSSESDSASFEVIVAPTVIEEALPPNLVDGINYDSDPTKATLVLTAPFKEFVQIAGSWNNYSPSNSDVMKRDPSTGKYWLEITGLTPGQVETYQYWVYDTNPIANSPSLVKAADPYSTLVLSPFDDPFIPAGTFPNLPPYPAGQEREVTVLQTGQTPYNWQVTNFVKPKEEDLIIYELLVRDFDADRNYQDIIDRIDYFKNLNINAIELMPVMEFEGNESWGYNTAFHMALDKFYGTPEKFKELVDVCHQNGIAVILDLAFNHAFGRNPLVRMWMDDPDGDGWGGPSAENPFFNQYETNSFGVGNDFDHSSSYTRDHVKQVIQYWVEEYKIDGYRWDLTKGFTQNCPNTNTSDPNYPYGGDFGCTQSYQQDRIDVLKEYVDHIWNIDPDHYSIFEHLGTDNEEKEWANYRLGEGKGIMMWGKMTSEYNELTMGQDGNKDFRRIGHNNHFGFNGPRVIGYPESHDEERLMYNNLVNGKNFGGYNVTDLNTALSRMSALGAISLLVPGPKMIWHFGELGMENSIFTCNNGSTNFPGDGDGSGDCKLDTKPQPQWANNWLSDALRGQIYNDWARMHALKINEAVFEGNYTINQPSQWPASFVPRIDIFDGSIPDTALKNVVVFANFDVVNQTFNPNFPGGVTSTWYDLMDESGTTTVSQTTTSITLAPGEFRVFGNQSVGSLSTSDETFAQFSIYPNPANTSFSISLNVSDIEIYDLTGKMIKQFKGSFTRIDTFDISSLNTGMYIVKVENYAGNIMTSKLVKL
jgi:1,4-alpha-glucan branching enzyme